ncbi:MAG: hypothetical protein ACRERR_01165 [Moraxellaceae bacterium]
MIRPAHLLFLTSALLALPALAAEALNNKAMDRAYIPETTPCLPDKDKDKNKRKGCESAAIGALEEKTLRDAEQQNVRQQLGNPNLNNPDALPPPAQLPPPELSPERQQLIEQIRHLPGQP